MLEHISWKKTLHLPKSSFPARALVKDRPKYLQRCTDDLYTWQRNRQLSKTFTLQDGPPYANGDLHIGHALNKILKDIICRSRLSDHRVDWRPGWDCHGLPIELKALQKQGDLTSKDAISIRAAARRLATKTVENQKQAFRQWGIMADWDNPWTTMDKNFEIKQLGVFKEMAAKGLIYRRFKPVYWSPSSRTALAEAELEYRDDHVSRAVFVKYPLTGAPNPLKKKMKIPLDSVSAVIWTTTPWTLPANLAIGFHQDIEYTLAQSATHGPLLLASSRLSHMTDHLNEDLRPITKFGGEALFGTTYGDGVFSTNSPSRPLLHANLVTETSGSGLVHFAPGHGMDEYELCLDHGITAFAPVDEEGCFTSNANPEEAGYLAGKGVLGDGGQAVIYRLKARGRLLAQHSHTHKYPYDWRSKRPVIVRATEQWFANAGQIKGAALQALDHVKFLPPSSKTRLQSFVKNRSEWCISRQRAWGVPIPALYHEATNEALLSEESIAHIISVIKERGVDAWWTDDDQDAAWTLPSFRTADGNSPYRRGQDTMDVWFDSGTTWTQTDNQREVYRHVADCYIEGTDQHRGWFQSSLLTHVADQCGHPVDQTSAVAPFRTLITHGFILDKDSRKMSKSIGNVISPSEIMEGSLLPATRRKIDGKMTDVRDAMGPDALRLWVASCDYTSDVKVSQTVLQAINGSLSKYRVTFKLMLGILQDFDPSSYKAPKDLGMMHQIVLWRLEAVNNNARGFYDSFEFSKAANEINKFVINDLSSSYFEWIKDAAYCGSVKERRQVQGTLFQIYRHLQQMLVPIVPLLIQETWDYTPTSIKEYETAPPGQRPWSNFAWNSENFGHLAADHPHLMKARAAIKNLQETARNDKKMGDSLESSVLFEIEAAEPWELFDKYGRQQLANLFGVSSFGVVLEDGLIQQCLEGNTGVGWHYTSEFEVMGERVSMLLYEPEKAKCIRCWRYTADVKKDSKEDSDVTVCKRCQEVVTKLRETNPEHFG